MMTWIMDFHLFLRISGCIYYYFPFLLSVKLLDTKSYTSDVVLRTCGTKLQDLEADRLT
jgi:hypothetical protein